MFLMSRRFYKSRSGGTYTELIFKEDGMWLLDTKPEKRKQAKGKRGRKPKSQRGTILRDIVP